MKILTCISKIPGISSVVLYSETLKDDYLFNHQLSIVGDVDDDENAKFINRYDTIPDTTLTSDRHCVFNVIFVQKGYF